MLAAPRGHPGRASGALSATSAGGACHEVRSVAHVAVAAALALAGCGSPTTRRVRWRRRCERRPSRRRARRAITANDGDGRRALPAHRSRGAGLQRDPAGDRRLLQARQRQRRRARPQAEDDHPRRRLQPGQHGQGDQAARAAGQGLRDPRRARHADAHQGRRLPQRRRRCRTSSCPPAAAAGTTPRSTRTRSAGSPTTRSRARSSASTSPRTSRARRSPTSSRTTTSAPTAPPGWTCTCPKEQVVTRQTYEPGNTDIGPQMAKIKASGAEVVASFSIPAYTALQLLAGVKLDFHPQMVVSQRRRGPDDADRPAEVVLQGRGGRVADRRHRHRRLPAAARRRLQQLDRAVRQDPRPVHPEAPQGRQRAATGWRWRTRSSTRSRQAGANPTRQDLVDTLEKGGMKGPGLVPYRFSAESHAGFTGVQMGKIDGRRLRARGPAGRPPTTAKARSPSTRRHRPTRPPTASPPSTDT